jgi:hypothetical protein
MCVPVTNEVKPLFEESLDLDILVALVWLKPSPAALVDRVRSSGSNYPHFILHEFREQLASYFGFDFALLPMRVEVRYNFGREAYDSA